MIPTELANRVDDLIHLPQGYPVHKLVQLNQTADIGSSLGELVDKNGRGWFYRHAHGVEKFILKNSELIDSRKVPQAEKIRKDFDGRWYTKVEQLQNSIFNPKTKCGWVFRFDNAIAEALELGPLQNYEIDCRKN